MSWTPLNGFVGGSAASVSAAVSEATVSLAAVSAEVASYPSPCLLSSISISFSSLTSTAPRRLLKLRWRLWRNWPTMGEAVWSWSRSWVSEAVAALPVEVIPVEGLLGTHRSRHLARFRLKRPSLELHLRFLHRVKLRVKSRVQLMQKKLSMI